MACELLKSANTNPTRPINNAPTVEVNSTLRSGFFDAFVMIFCVFCFGDYSNIKEGPCEPFFYMLNLLFYLTINLISAGFDGGSR